MRKRIKQLKHIVDLYLVIVKLCFFNSKIYFIEKFNNRQLNFDTRVDIVKNTRKIYLIIDIEISISNFVNFKFVKQHKLFTIILTKFIKFRLTNVKQTSRIIQIIQIKFQLSDHVNEF